MLVGTFLKEEQEWEKDSLRQKWFLGGLPSGVCGDEVHA